MYLNNIFETTSDDFIGLVGVIFVIVSESQSFWSQSVMILYNSINSFLDLAQDCVYMNMLAIFELCGIISIQMCY